MLVPTASGPTTVPAFSRLDAAVPSEGLGHNQVLVADESPAGLFESLDRRGYSLAVSVPAGHLEGFELGRIRDGHRGV